MTSSEIREAVAKLSEYATSEWSHGRPHAQSVISLGMDLLGQALVDFHDIADAVRSEEEQQR